MGGSASVFIFVPKNMIAVALLFEWYTLYKINGTYTVCIYSCVHLLISQKLNILIEWLILMIYIWGVKYQPRDQPAVLVHFFVIC